MTHGNSVPATTNPYARLAQCDPTGTIDLEDTVAVEAAIGAVLREAYGDAWDAGLLAASIADAVAAYRGDYPGLLRCDTLYHDLRHALESGLTVARLIVGHGRSSTVAAADRIDAEHALLAVLLAIFHDIGLLRRDSESHLWGAVLTPVHEERGVEFMRAYLSRTVLAQWSEKSELIMATKLIFHIPPTWSAQDRLLGSLIASADLLSQLSDRCYLEKCRDFLFLEFSAIGLAGTENTPYPDRETLLEKTPGFFSGLIRQRLEEEFSGVQRYMNDYFGGASPYEEAIHRNLDYLAAILSSGDFTRLRRCPKPFIDTEN